MKGFTKGFFVGKYKLLDHLGTGGMSQVYLGEHTLMRRRVALKILNQELTESSSYLTRFYRESQATAQLDHPNIVRTFDVDCEGKLHYMVMEYMKGPCLQSLIEDAEEYLEFETVADHVHQACEGLQHAHDAGLIHRDIKPGNLMLTPGKIVKLLDFGMVRLTQDEMSSITIKHNESMLGTADYLSPEQALDSHHVDLRTDIYSMGCTFYYLMTGHPPFNEGSMALRLMMHQTEEPPAISVDRPDVPEELVKICSRMMAKKAEDRFQTAGEASAALQGWLARQGFGGGDGSVFSAVQAQTGEEDTLDGTVNRTMVTNETATYMIDDSAESQIKVSCGSCGALVWVPVRSMTSDLNCPGCSKPLAASSGSNKPPAAEDSNEFKDWKYQEFETAMLEEDSQFFPALRSLSDRFPDNEKVAKVLARLLTRAAAVENEE
ncbi:MAG: serine/threonine protein kinase, partial [Planctomycetales bacterium]